MVKTLQIMAYDKIVCMLLDMYVGEKYKRSFTYTKLKQELSRQLDIQRIQSLYAGDYRFAIRCTRQLSAELSDDLLAQDMTHYFEMELVRSQLPPTSFYQFRNVRPRRR